MKYYAVNAKLPFDVVMRFREAIYLQRGLHKGDFQDCLIEAMELWVKVKSHE